MAVRFIPFTDSHIDAVKAFNLRLRAGGMAMQYPTEVTPRWLPAANDGRRLFQEQYIGVDVSDQVRGGYILKHQDFKIADAVVPIADLRLPISEGAVDRQHTSVASELLFDALAKQRLLFGMGIGGYHEPVTKLFQAAGWRVFTIPFFFRVIHPFRFCRRIRFLRRTWYRRAALDLAAYSGAAWAGVKAWQSFRSGLVRHDPRIRAVVVPEFADWCDELWQRCHGQYTMIAVRDAEVLRLLYPRCDERFVRLQVFDRERLIGWAVMLDTVMRDHKQFGSLRVGSLVDGLAATDDAQTVVRAATRHLEQRGVDLVIANHSHRCWGDALRASGYLDGPSNYLFAASRALDKRWKSSSIENDDTFLNRGDGDGPINL